MALSAGARQLAQPRVGVRLNASLLAAVAAVVAVLAVSLPLFLASPAHLTSDESLYVAEAYGIAQGKGLTYPSGEAITHRAPLYPLILAPAVRLAGPDAAYTLTRALVVANALLVMLLAWRMAGPVAGLLAGVTAAASRFLDELGTTLYLDPAQCTFLLLSLLALHAAMRRHDLRLHAASGLLVGLAFLMKESAVQWAPLGVAAWLALPRLRSGAGARGAAAFTLAFAAMMAPWLAWVWFHTGEIFLAGKPHASTLVLVAVAAIALIGCLALLATPAARLRTIDAPLRRCAPLAAVTMIAAWGAFMLWSLTAHSQWGYPDDYVQNVPAYLRDVAPRAQPFFLFAAAWAWASYAAVRGDERARLLAVAALLFAPFALFIANRGLQLRDALPLVYLSHVVVGIGGAELWSAARRNAWGDRLAPALTAVGVLLAGVFAMHQTAQFRDENRAASADTVRVDSWGNPFEQRIAAWMSENIPAASTVLTSRLYFSSLYVDTGGRFEVRQLPTVRVDVDPGGERLLTPASNLFRWGDTDVRPAAPDEPWISLRQFPGKGYWVALSQQELLDYAADHDVDYVVITGEDAAFSSLPDATFLLAHPAFTLLNHEAVSPSDQLFVFAVDSTRLQPIPYPLVMARTDLAALERETRLSLDEIQRRLRVEIRQRDLEHGLSTGEIVAALNGATLP
ncbi:MAG: glycosyltransferase family 39 protein [Dehalococcoidia bacterium]